MNGPTHLLYSGPLHAGQTSRARMEGLRDAGLDVVTFDHGAAFARQARLLRAIQLRTYVGPAALSANRTLLALADAHRPEVAWIDKGAFIYPWTLRALRRRGVRLVHYNTDDIMCRRHPSFVLRRTIPLYDLHFTTNRANVADLERLGARAVALSALRYDDRIFGPRRFSDAELAPYRADAVFIGHWEEATEEAVLRIVDAGISLRVWGENWHRARDRRRLEGVVAFRSLWLDDYVKALHACKVALCFLSKWNRNTAACRSFEIPATRAFLLAERTDEHLESYREGVEAEFFGDPKEMTDKLRYYVEHDAERAAIAARGHVRCLESGYSYRAQMPRDWRQVEERRGAWTT